jgi:hypothetical protein
VPIALRALATLLSTAQSFDSATMATLVNFGATTLFGVWNVLLCMSASCWLGMWFGLRAPSSTRAIGWTVSLVQLAPFLISNIWLYSLTFMLPGFSGYPRSSYAYFIWWLPQITVMIFFVWLIFIAKRRLLETSAVGEPATLSLRHSLSDAARNTFRTFKQLRHWTPS